MIRSIKIVLSAPRLLRHYEYSGLAVTFPVRLIRSTKKYFRRQRTLGYYKYNGLGGTPPNPVDENSTFSAGEP